MLRLILAAGLLICMASASGAASFRYTSSSVVELDYFFQAFRRGGEFDVDDLFKRRDLDIVFEINAPIRRNKTYVYDEGTKNWTISITAGGAATGYNPFDRATFEDFEISIETDENRQVSDWRIYTEVDFGIDYFWWFSNSNGEQSDGYYEYISAECIEENPGDFDACERGLRFRTNGIGSWAPVTPVPLPASLPFLAAGLAALGLVRRRRLR